jgi:CheY-like chemotaxis protein
MAVRILIVEDEAALRSVMAAYLERLGYAVDTAVSTETAWDRFSSAPTVYALVIVDMSMPGIGGNELARRLLEMNRELRLIATSGYPLEPAPLEALAEGRVAFLPKPFTPDTLVQTIERLLSGYQGLAGNPEAHAGD